jgi:hypothetical protein
MALSMKSPIECARANLHHALAARVTARQRLLDAEDTFAEVHDCPASFVAASPASASLAYWDAQVRLAEKNVIDCELRLGQAMVDAGR